MSEKRLQEIEIELDKAYDEHDKLQETEPPYDENDAAGSFERYRAHMKPATEKIARLGREKRMLMTPEFEELSDYGDVMSLEHFLDCVKGGGFIDYDGFGKYVRDGRESNIEIYPSDIQYGSIRDDFDTIIWFNK